jgi:hypothetical protein
MLYTLFGMTGWLMPGSSKLEPNRLANLAGLPLIPKML